MKNKDYKKKNDLINKSHNKFSFLNKKTIIASIISSSIAVVPIAATIFFSTQPNNYYSIDGKLMGFESAANKLYQQAEVFEYDKEVDAQWKINLNNEELIFNNPTELRNTVFNKIISKQEITAPFSLENKIDINTGKISISDSDLAQFIANNNSKTVTVYKKNGNGITTNQDEAYSSYFNTKDSYFFNDIYFNSKEDLRSYLINQYLPNTQDTKYNNFVVVAPNGVKSNPISTKLEDSQKSAEYLKKFIANNNEKVLKYTNSKTQEETFFTKQNYLSNLNKINIKDLSYQHVYSNQGESRYVVDNIYTDDNNLIGPYFYEGNLDIGSFTNIDMWRKTNGINKAVYAESKIDSAIGLFFKTIVNDDNVYLLKQAELDNKDPVIFNTPLINSLGKSIDEQFLIDLGTLSPKLKQEVVKANKTLLTGKKYNTFFKLPIMYNFMMNRIVSWNLSNEIYTLVINYFTKIANFIQDAIEVVTLYNKDLLVGQDGKSFNAKEFFCIGNSEYDISTSTEYFLNHFKTNYPKLIAAISAFNSAATNIFLGVSLIPFSSIDQKYLFDYKVITAADYETSKPALEEIYNVFSKLDYKSMALEYINLAGKYNTEIGKIASLPESEKIIQFDKILTTNKSAEIGLFLKAIGLKNTQSYLQMQALLISELKLFFQRGMIVHGGYLYQIDNNNDASRIYSLTNYALENPDSNEIFKFYYSLLIDFKMKLNIFNSSMSTNPTAFAQAISRISLGLLGSIGGVASLTKNFFGSKKGLVHINNHPFVNKVSDVVANPFLYGNNTNIYPFRWSDNLFDFISLDQWKVFMVKIFPRNYNNVIRHFPYLTKLEELEVIKHWVGIRSPGQFIGQTNIDLLRSNIIKNIRTTVGSDNSNNITLVEPSNTNLNEVTNRPIYSVSNDDSTALPNGNNTGSNNSGNAGSNNGNGSGNGNSGTGNDSGGGNGSNNGNNKPNKPSKPNKPVKPNYPPPSPPATDKLAPGFKKDELMIPNHIDQSKKKEKSTFRLFDIKDNQSTSSHSFSNKHSKLRWIKSDFVEKAMDKTADVFKFLNKYFLEILGGMFAISEFVFLILDFLKVEEIQDFYVYTTIDGTEFIWDGGKTTSRYFGFQVDVINKLNQGDLLTPVQITLPQIEEFYYYNQVKYYDATELKRAVVENKLFKTELVQSGGQFKTLYSFDKPTENAELLFAAESVDKLIEHVFNNLNITSTTDSSNITSYNFTNLNKDSQYITNTSFAFSNGVSTNSSNLYPVIAQNVVENIRATKVAKKIKVQDGVVLDLDNSFNFPGLTYKNGNIIDNSKYSSDYLVDNSANELKPNSSITSGSLSPNDFVYPSVKEAERSSLNKLFNVFKSSFKLQFKNATYTSWYNTSNFDELSGDKNSYIIYYTKPIGSINSGLFLSAYDAEKYIYKYMNITKEIVSVKEKAFIINNNVYASQDDFYEFVKSHAF